MSERGSVTLWMLGLGLMLLSLGGLSLDLWILMTDRRELAAVADAAAVAAASAVDEGEWRRGGVVTLDGPAAVERALWSLERQQVDVGEARVAVRGAEVTVEVERRARLTLLRLVHPRPVVVRALARAEARIPAPAG